MSDEQNCNAGQTLAASGLLDDFRNLIGEWRKRAEPITCNHPALVCADELEAAIFMAEYKLGMHKLNDEDRAALDVARPFLVEEIHRILHAPILKVTDIPFPKGTTDNQIVEWCNSSNDQAQAQPPTATPERK